MIAFRNSGTDDNPSGTQANRVKVLRPSGVVDGDFLLAFVGVQGGSAVVVTPPVGWNLISRTDATADTGLAAYYRFASGEPSGGWSWAFSTTDYHTVAVCAYTGVDAFTPLDVKGSAASTGSTSAIVPTMSASGTGVQVVAYSVDASYTSTLPSGFTSRASKRQGTTQQDLVAADIAVTTNGALATATGTLNVAASAVAYGLVLRPASAKSSVEQVRQALKAHFPPGADSLYDWDNVDAELYKLTVAIATFLKKNGYDYADLAVAEFNPMTTVAKLPEWEAALAITQTVASAANTSIYSRRNAVISKLRESGASTIDNIRSVCEPLLGYSGSNLGTLEVIECDRLGLRSLHTYRNATGGTASLGNDVVQTVYVSDDGLVSAAGVQLAIKIETGHLEYLTLSLVGPAGSQASVSWTLAPSGLIFSISPAQTFYMSESATSAAKTIKGTWTLTASMIGSSATISSWELFVEGAGHDSSTYSDTESAQTQPTAYTLYRDGLGGDIFDWGIYADPLKVNNPDYAAVRLALKRVGPAYSKSHIFFTKNPIPAAAATISGCFYGAGYTRSWLPVGALPPAVALKSGPARRFRSTALTSQFCAFKFP